MTGVALAGVAGAAALVTARQLAPPGGPPEPAAVSTSTAGVTRASVAERQFVNGTLGYADAFVVPGSGEGTLTWLPPTGTVVNAGDAVYEVDGRPVALLYGDRPAWRGFSGGMTDGADVEQLETNLRDLGFGDGLTVDRRFTSATSNAIRRWQRAGRGAVTGELPLGSVAFLPGPIRVSGHELRLGAPVAAGAPVEYATRNEPVVLLTAAASQLGWVKAGDAVLVTLPGSKTRNGTVRTVAAASDQNPPTVTVTVRVDGDLTGLTGLADRATVPAWVIRARHDNVLTVPIAALNAVADGRYEVIVVDGASTRRVPVRTGLFDDLTATVEVSGDGLAEGQKVRVPRDDA
nr:peptidoglycan-binding protein [Dactylosporangium thailandense]